MKRAVRGSETCFLFLAVALTMTAPALADVMVSGADIGIGSNYVEAVGGASSSFFLYSNSTMPLVGPNAGTVLDGSAIGSARGIDIVIGSNSYSPIVGETNVPKPTAASGVQVGYDSSTAVVNGTSKGVFSKGVVFLPSRAFPSGGLSTSALTALGGGTGKAASIVYDPEEVTGPASGYFDLNTSDSSPADGAYPIDATLYSSAPGDFTAVEFAAIDSRFEVDPSNPGDPLNYLWALTISADGPINSDGSLNVSFVINPLATIAGGGSANVVTNSSDDPLLVSAVLSRVFGALSIKDGVATLNLVDLFPVGTEYHVPYGTTITYGVLDGSAISNVPEPRYALLSLAVLGLLCHRAGRRFSVVRGSGPR